MAGESRAFYDVPSQDLLMAGMGNGGTPRTSTNSALNTWVAKVLCPELRMLGTSSFGGRQFGPF